MREAEADLRATPAEAALTACLATVLELPVEEVPEPEPGAEEISEAVGGVRLRPLAGSREDLLTDSGRRAAT